MSKVLDNVKELAKIRGMIFTNTRDITALKSWITKLSQEATKNKQAIVEEITAARSTFLDATSVPDNNAGVLLVSLVWCLFIFTGVNKRYPIC